MFVRIHDTLICFSVKSTKLVEMAMGLTRKPIEKKVELLALRIWNFFLLLSPCFRDICCRKRPYTHKHLLHSISRTILCHDVMNNVFRYVHGWKFFVGYFLKCLIFCARKKTIACNFPTKRNFSELFNKHLHKYFFLSVSIWTLQHSITHANTDKLFLRREGVDWKTNATKLIKTAHCAISQLPCT